MGSLILCDEKKAKQPYEIARIHKKIYTIEELCYYISNNLYLIDYTIVNKQLCEWLMEELDMDGLAKELRACIRKNGSVEQFVLLILRASSIYTEQELKKIEDIMKHLKNQKDGASEIQSGQPAFKRRNRGGDSCVPLHHSWREG